MENETIKDAKIHYMVRKILFIATYNLYKSTLKSRSSRKALCRERKITVRLTFLTHSVRMRPNFQGLPWFNCDGLGEMNS
jgi:hypothetical protein